MSIDIVVAPHVGITDTETEEVGRQNGDMKNGQQQKNEIERDTIVNGYAGHVMDCRMD